MDNRSPAPGTGWSSGRNRPVLVAINARATARREIGGVERLAHEMARRLPALAPGRYRVCRPPAALAHRAGHLWEQAGAAGRAGAPGSSTPPRTWRRWHRAATWW